MSEIAPIPVVALHGHVIVTVQGAPTDSQIAALREEICALVDARDAVGLAIDLSAVRELDSYLTRAIRDVAMLARLMGVATVVCGIRPAVAITLVDMGLELPGVQTAMNLERAVELLDELVAESERAEAEDDDDAADGDDLESGDEVDAG